MYLLFVPYSDSHLDGYWVGTRQCRVLAYICVYLWLIIFSVSYLYQVRFNT
jgi:hypothetical protein